jgi:predicted DNA-binding WGR domain protein
MSFNRVRLFGYVWLVAATLAAITGAAQGSVRVGGWAFSANGQLARNFQYTGACPVDLTFDWGVIGTEATAVVYSLSRNDGGHSASPGSINLPTPNQSVSILEHWYLGANTPQFADYRGWVQLNIESPNPVSRRIDFTIHCAGSSVRVGGGSFSANGQLARYYQYAGTCPVDLTFDWGVIGTEATAVVYSFTRNDGAHSSSSSTINLLGPNRSVPILEHWLLGANTPQFANYTGWPQLNIASPNQVSNKIGFTIHCQ